MKVVLASGLKPGARALSALHTMLPGAKTVGRTRRVSRPGPLDEK